MQTFTMQVAFPQGHLGALTTWGPSSKHLLELEPVWFKVLLSTDYVQLPSGLAGT